MKSVLAILGMAVASGLMITIPEKDKQPSKITKATQPHVLTSKEVLEATSFYQEQQKDSLR